MVLVLPFAKILATSLSIGSGGSGGIFGPGMVIGGMLGAAFWRLGHGVLPRLPHSPAPFVIVGMMALFGGIAHAPLAVMLMVAEMTGNLRCWPRRWSPWRLDRAGRRQHHLSQPAAQSGQLAGPPRPFRVSFAASLLVRDAMHPPGALIRATASIRDALALLAEQGTMVLGVVDERSSYVGVVTARNSSALRKWTDPRRPFARSCPRR